MGSPPIAIAGKAHSSASQSTRNSLSSAASRGLSEPSSYSRSSAAELKRRGSQASSKQSISTRDTSFSGDDLPVHGVTSPTSSIRSSRPRRPRVMSVSKGSSHSTRLEAVDPMVFHRRSTQLFATSPIYGQQQLPHPRRPSIQRMMTSPEAIRPRTSVLNRTITQPEEPTYHIDFTRSYQLQSPTRSAESIDEPAVEPDAVIHWTSDETRRKEYADIDRSRKGLRGLWNKVAPKFARSGTSSRFYDENDGSDAGSVRRFRLDLSADAKN